MIVGVTHVAMEASLDVGIGAVESTGFVPRFADRLVLPATFEQVGDAVTQYLPLAVLAAPDSIEIEVVDHAAQSGNLGAYCAVFRSPPPEGAGPLRRDSDEVAEALVALGFVGDPMAARLPGSGPDAWFDGTGSGPGLAAVVCAVADPAASAGFWCRWAKATATEHGRTVGVTVASRMRGPACRFLLVPGPTDARYAMNDSGFPSIGVLSSAIAKDCETAVAAGGRLRAEPVDTTVNDLGLTLALVEDPCGALIELLGPSRRAAR